jgi:hypothetical protein
MIRLATSLLALRDDWKGGAVRRRLCGGGHRFLLSLYGDAVSAL